MKLLCDFSYGRAIKLAKKHLPEWEQMSTMEAFSSTSPVKHITNASLIRTIGRNLEQKTGRVRTIRDSTKPNRPVLGLVQYHKEGDRYLIQQVASNPEYRTGRVASELRKKFKGKKAAIENTLPEARYAYEKGGWKLDKNTGDYINE